MGQKHQAPSITQEAASSRQELEQRQRRVQRQRQRRRQRQMAALVHENLNCKMGSVWVLTLKPPCPVPRALLPVTNSLSPPVRKPFANICLLITCKVSGSCWAKFVAIRHKAQWIRALTFNYSISKFNNRTKTDFSVNLIHVCLSHMKLFSTIEIMCLAIKYFLIV